MRTKDRAAIAAIVAFIILFWLAVCAAIYTEFASAHYYDGCQKYRCKTHVVAPFKPMLHSIAYCETGGTMNPQIHNPSGTYHGLFQFDLGSWHGAGGFGDPHNASVTEQRYRAVVWLHRNGRQSWPNC